jgi:hypothetical protein
VQATATLLFTDGEIKRSSSSWLFLFGRRGLDVDESGGGGGGEDDGGKEANRGEVSASTRDLARGPQTCARWQK